MTGAAAGIDRERLADADHVLHGPGGARLASKVLYAVYVFAVLTLIYAYAVLRAVLVSSDTLWVRAALAGWRGVYGAIAGLALLAWGAWWLGSRRGPATPPLPWIDHVATSSIGRRLTLGPWWLAALAGVGGCGVVLGGIVGGSVYAAGLAGVVALPMGMGVGGLLAAGLCWLWLVSQARASGRVGDLPALGVGQALAALGLDELRAHARRGQRLYGAMLAGDPRAARLEVTSPIRGGRGVRLRPGRFVATVVRRDLVGLRRQPGVALAGVILVGLGTWMCALTIRDASTPIPVTILGIALSHLGVGQWAQGLRFSADGLSASPVFGGSAGRRALGHSVVPFVAHGAVGAAVGAFVWLGSGGSANPMLMLTAQTSLGLLLVTGQWSSAFRVAPTAAAYLPETGPFLLVLSVIQPWLVVLGPGTFALHRAARSPMPWVWVGVLAGIGLVAAWRGRALVRQLVEAGR